MKKFNLDELLWFVIQLLLLVVMVYLKASGQIVNFIGKRMMFYYSLSVVILIVYSLAQVSKIFTIRSRNPITNKFYPMTFVIILIVGFFYIEPNYRLLTNGSNIDINNLSNDMEINDVIIIDSSNFDIIKEINSNNNNYLGKVIQFVGAVTNIDSTEEITIGREVISCCQSDKWLIEIKAKGITNINKGKWIDVIGKISTDGNELYIESIQFKEINEPFDIYLHEQL